MAQGPAQGGGRGLAGSQRGPSLLREGWCRQWGLLGDHSARGRAEAEREAQAPPTAIHASIPRGSGIGRQREGPQ